MWSVEPRLLPESCVRMPWHRPETAERRGSPGDPWEPTSTGILCTHALAPTGNSRAPWLIRPPTGTHFYRNPVYACLGTDRKLPSALAHPATHGSPLLPEFCVRTPWHRPEIAERRGSPITLRTPALLESRVRGPDADWNQLSAVAIEAIQVQESCVRKHGVIGLWRTPVSCWARDSPSSYRKQACALPSVSLQGGGPRVLRSART